jgi:hypothetical protein
VETGQLTQTLLLHTFPERSSTGKRQEKASWDVGTLFIAHAQATKLIKPRESPFNHPTPSA